MSTGQRFVDPNSHDVETTEVVTYDYGDIRFEWHIRTVPHDSDDGRKLRAAQARAIRNLLKWVQDAGEDDPSVPGPATTVGRG